MWNVSRQDEGTEKEMLLASHVMEGRAKLNKPNNHIELINSRWVLMHRALPWLMYGIMCALWSIALPAISAPVAIKPLPTINKQSIPNCQSVQHKSFVITLGKIERIPLPDGTKRIFIGGQASGKASGLGSPPKSSGEDGYKFKQTITKQKSDSSQPEITVENFGTIKPIDQTSSSTGVAEADVVPLSSTEFYLLGKKTGTMNVIIQDIHDQCTMMDLTVTMDAPALQDRLGQLLPKEKSIKVSAVEDTFILSGTVSDSVKVDQAVTLANAYAGGTAGSNSASKVVNMLQVTAPQQVMLEVKMAEVSKNLLDKLGASFGASRHNGGVAYAIAAGFLSLTGAGIDPLSPGGLLTISHGNTLIKLDAENKDGVVKILAEPNIIAISGQEGSFLAGGKIFIPVPQAGTAGGITLEEKEFGVGLRFTPTVLEDGLINLKVSPEVSELIQSEVTANGSALPSFTTRRVATTVQLRDGQSFAIAGLIKNNVTENIRRFPILGSIPILGALFRSSSFQNDKTELLFVITPRLVKPLPPDYILPTDSFVAPSDKEFFLGGKLEGKPDESATTTPAPVAPAPKATKPESAEPDGFEMK